MKEFFKKKLKNGVTVLFEKRKLPVVSVSASIRFGAAYETERNKGISHFIEHLMFKGTKTRKQEEIAREIEKKGGILNAYTSEEVTSYWNKMPSRHLDSAISIASDLILNPEFYPVEFEREKKVIIEEIKMYHDNPLFYAPDRIKELLYKKPFGMSVAGNEKIVRSISRQEAVNLFHSFYTSDSMIVCVVGDADFDNVCLMTEKLFPQTAREILRHNPVRINEDAVEKRAGIDQSHFILGFHAPFLGDTRRYDYEIAGCYLFEGMSSVLFQEIREKRGLAYSVKGNFDLGVNYGHGTIYVGTTREKIKKAREIILSEIKNLKKLKKKDFDECKEQLIGLRKLAEEDSSNSMNVIVQEELAGNADEYYRYEERINSARLEDVRKLAGIKNFSSFSLIPK